MSLDARISDHQFSYATSSSQFYGSVSSEKLNNYSPQNCFFRPADIRASLNSAVASVVELKKKEAIKRKTRGPFESSRATVKNDAQDNENPTYHFIGYVPAFGKVWELDGIKSGPLEVGELASSESGRKGWMDVVRPALRLKMAKYGGSGSEGSDIRFSLLAFVQENHSKLIDKLEYLKKDKEKVESLFETPLQEKVVYTILLAHAL